MQRFRRVATAAPFALAAALLAPTASAHGSWDWDCWDRQDRIVRWWSAPPLSAPPPFAPRSVAPYPLPMPGAHFPFASPFAAPYALPYLSPHVGQSARFSRRPGAVWRDPFDISNGYDVFVPPGRVTERHLRGRPSAVHEPRRGGGFIERDAWGRRSGTIGSRR